MYVPGENTQHNEHNALQVLTDVFWTRAQMWHDDVTHTVVVIFQILSKYYEDLFYSLNQQKSYSDTNIFDLNATS